MEKGIDGVRYAVQIGLVTTRIISEVVKCSGKISRLKLVLLYLYYTERLQRRRQCYATMKRERRFCFDASVSANDNEVFDVLHHPEIIAVSLCATPIPLEGFKWYFIIKLGEQTSLSRG